MSLLGETWRQVRHDLGVGHSYVGDVMGDRPPPPPTRRLLPREYVRAVMQIVVSLIVLGGGLYVLLEGNEQAGQAAAGSVGAVIGYWLR